MLDYFKDFILNIFIIFTPLVMYPYIYKMKERNLLYSFLIYILFAIAIVATMSFPVVLNEIIYDFRSIPLAVGSLYGGLSVSGLLYLTIVAYRFLNESPHHWIYILSLMLTFVLVVLSLRIFDNMKTLYKILIAVCLSVLIKFLTLTVYFIGTGQFELLFIKPWTITQTYIVQAVLVGFYVYLIEFLNRYFYMQEEVIKSEKMKIISDMAASVAHEIRNPLTAVRGFIHLFGSENVDREKKAMYQQICFEELDRTEHIITDYLALAQPDPEITEELHVQDELMYLSNVLTTYGNYNQIKIHVIFAQERPFYITGDRHKFRQALLNIGKHAIEAMQEGGVLTLHVGLWNDYAKISMRDTGQGMTAEQIRRLGTPYYCTKEKGTGLEMTVAFSMIKKMNGKIDIRSKMGKGTEFILLFPIT
ncbi:ATP-binding protein [Paenibacillus guangzhouensis]|uniref:ATP-binding protein n=1 Tax=Paenibacillus guangzhouensis TaxID=1473112 RepID=UPI00187B9D85|nr:ATP-binding protein [Paenibacillus guangzhouensis]